MFGIVIFVIDRTVILGVAAQIEMSCSLVHLLLYYYDPQKENGCTIAANFREIDINQGEKWQK
jgi:hypothetical protein